MHRLKNIATKTLQTISTQQAWHYGIIPFDIQGQWSFFVAEKKWRPDLNEELEVLLGQNIYLERAPDVEIEKALGIYYRNKTKQSEKEVAQLDDINSNDFFLQIVQEAKDLNSSDIHLEPYENKCRVRIRIDGILIERYFLEKQKYPSLVNKIKIRANLDIAEKRLPQDGRIFFQDKSGQKIDIRVSVMPTLHGEKVVMRLLRNDATNIDLQTLGFSKTDLDNYLEAVQRPNGMLLVSGPTGSGKTTTLYATLKLLNKNSRNILTIEDPIEYTLEGINQMQLKENIGLDFATALRTFLRQDPDIIMVGEIRDKATASMAIRASLTGHLVLSTLHTSSAWGIVARLVDMGIAPYLLADTLNAAVAQRLLRLLCPTCKKKTGFAENLLPKRFKAPYLPASHYRPVGCGSCFFTGYKGRVAVYEIIPIDNFLAQKIKNSEFQIPNLLEERQIKTLAQNAFSLLEKGMTSIEEVYPILASNS